MRAEKGIFLQKLVSFHLPLSAILKVRLFAKRINFKSVFNSVLWLLYFNFCSYFINFGKIEENKTFSSNFTCLSINIFIYLKIYRFYISKRIDRIFLTNLSKLVIILPSLLSRRSLPAVTCLWLCQGVLGWVFCLR